MKQLLERKWVLLLLCAILLCLLATIWSALSPSHASPVANLVNVLTTPIQRAITETKNGVVLLIDHFTEYDAMKAENEALHKELAETQSALRNAEQVALENVQLRGALNIKTLRPDFVFEPAEIIARSNETWSRTFTIDKGSIAGIAPDNCVITTDGLVGFVSEVGPNWAVVTTLIDSDAQFSAIATRTREVASASGDFALMSENRLRLTYLTKDTRLIQGDTVETSGLGGLFPKGILIGTVDAVQLESHGASKYAILTPAVDLGALTQVLVIKSFAVTE